MCETDGEVNPTLIIVLTVIRVVVRQIRGVNPGEFNSRLGKVQLVGMLDRNPLE